jgi:WD40 repeat protein
MTVAPKWVRAVAFSPDGSRVLAARDAMLNVWDAATAELVLEARDLGDVTAFPKFSADAGHLLVCVGRSLVLWNTATGKPEKTFKAAPERTGDADPKDIVAVALSADGRRAVSADRSQALQLWDAWTGRLLVPGFRLLDPGCGSHETMFPSADLAAGVIRVCSHIDRPASPTQDNDGAFRPSKRHELRDAPRGRNSGP